MLRKYKCKTCGKEFSIFDDELEDFLSDHQKDCKGLDIVEVLSNRSIVHSTANIQTGSMMDNISGIHEAESQAIREANERNMEKAADNARLNQ